LRISSAVDPIHAHPDFTLAAHACPDPADIVLVRLSMVFLHPEQFLGNLDDRLRNMVLVRLIRLWIALAENADASEVLSAISGTNIRHAFTCAIKWCLSEAFADVDVSEHDVAKALQVVQKLLMFYVCDYIGAAICEGIRFQFTLTDIRNVAQEASASKAMRCAILLCGRCGT
jgi:hypothetical protein